MFKVVVNGFATEKQARAWISWYEGQGEQDASVWADCQDEPFPHMTVMGKDWLKVDGNELSIQVK